MGVALLTKKYINRWYSIRFVKHNNPSLYKTFLQTIITIYLNTTNVEEARAKRLSLLYHYGIKCKQV